MIKILFVCLGNICRSPMAEFVFKDISEKRGLEDKFYIESAATSNEEVGNGVHYGTINKLKSEGVKIYDRKAKQIKKSDYKKFDYIIAMESKNIKDILRIVGEDKENKIYRLLDFSNNPRDIADPWYTGNFTVTYNDIVEGCNAFIDKMSKKVIF